MTEQEPGEKRLAQHRGYSRVFTKGKTTLGFILPLEGYPASAVPSMRQHVQMAQLADRLGFSALWARDIALYDPQFGDAGQVFDPFPYLGFLAGITDDIALGTGSTVLTLRHPLHVAKQAASVDQLSDGRLLLGVASGDRPIEYPAFGIDKDYEARGERFREAFEMFRLATEHSFAQGKFPRYGQLQGDTDLLPKPVVGKLVALVTGRSRQSIEWTAQNADGWFYYHVGLQQLQQVSELWHTTVAQLLGDIAFKPYAFGLFFDLDKDPDYPATAIHAGLRIGRHALVDYLHKVQAFGVNHVAFNMKAFRRDAEDVLHELAEFVLPHFPSH